MVRHDTGLFAATGTMRERTTCMLMKLAPSSIAAWNASSVSSVAPGPTSVG